MPGMLSMFKGGCCTNTCSDENIKKLEKNAGIFLSQGHTAAMKLLSQANKAAQVLDAKIPQLIVFLNAVKPIFATEPKMITAIDAAIEGLKVILASTQFAEEMVENTAAIQTIDGVTPVNLLDAAQAANVDLKAYVEALKALGLPIGNAPEIISTVDTALTKANAIKLLTGVFTSTPTASVTTPSTDLITTPEATVTNSAPALVLT